jgi:hypothetical protein
MNYSQIILFVKIKNTDLSGTKKLLKIFNINHVQYFRR